ncbi:MAG: hypothetical protein IJ229_10395 [Clostridia bacterium]|nr:hypothetical protein [Clostridia bacterium]MBR1686133.1 hypothetical protein [Clostridia bacterium]MBR2287847.1 hypothetical protein [Clostridia bacterium]
MMVTQELLHDFRKDLELAVKPLCEKYQMAISLGNITYGDECFSLKVSATLGTDPESVARARFDDDAWKFQDIGIHAGMYKQIFVGDNGKEYAVVELRPRARKSPIRVISLDDDQYYVCGKAFIKEWTNMRYAKILPHESENN